MFKIYHRQRKNGKQGACERRLFQNPDYICLVRSPRIREMYAYVLKDRIFTFNEFKKRYMSIKSPDFTKILIDELPTNAGDSALFFYRLGELGYDVEAYHVRSYDQKFAAKTLAHQELMEPVSQEVHVETHLGGSDIETVGQMMEFAIGTMSDTIKAKENQEIANDLARRMIQGGQH